MSCTVYEILLLVCDLTANITTNDLEKYLSSNAAVDVVAQGIIVISITGDIWYIFRDIDPS